MASEYKGVRNKSFTLPGITGGELVISETIDRESITVTIRNSGKQLVHSGTVYISAAQFRCLCRLDSAYDGLEVQKAAPKAVEEPADESEPERKS